MLPRLLLLIALFASASIVHASDLIGGMSTEEVHIDRGRPESKMELGPKLIYIYEDGTRLEFIDDKLVRKNDLMLNNSIKAQKNAFSESREESHLGAEPIVKTVQSETITISAQIEDAAYSFEALPQNNQDTETYEDDHLLYDYGKLDDTVTEKDRSLGILIGFTVEAVVTLVVLAIAFQISGFPCILRQLVLLSLAVAVTGVLFDLTFQADLLNPMRSGMAFIALLVLIRQMTDVREWTTAIRIALIARVISTAIIWLIMTGIVSLIRL